MCLKLEWHSYTFQKIEWGTVAPTLGPTIGIELMPLRAGAICSDHGSS